MDRGRDITRGAVAVQDHRRPGRLVPAALAAAIFVGSLLLWIAVPVGSLWLASHWSDDATTVVSTTLILCPLLMLLFGLLLARLHGAYLRAAGGTGRRGPRSAWLGSLSGDRAPRPPRSVLEVSLTLSAGTALVLMLVWFFFFAENTMPAGPVP